MRCSSAPCEKQGVDETIAPSKVNDMHDRTKCIGRSSVHLFRLSVLIRGLVVHSPGDFIMADVYTLRREPALVAKRQRL
jgi:hypothetical protein